MDRKEVIARQCCHSCLLTCSPDADGLVLVCQVVRAVPVVGLDDVVVGAVEVLRAAVRGKVLKVAGVLGHLGTGVRKKKNKIENKGGTDNHNNKDVATTHKDVTTKKRCDSNKDVTAKTNESKQQQKSQMIQGQIWPPPPPPFVFPFSFYSSHPSLPLRLLFSPSPFILLLHLLLLFLFFLLLLLFLFLLLLFLLFFPSPPLPFNVL